jgi:hypothetical protein
VPAAVLQAATRAAVHGAAVAASAAAFLISCKLAHRLLPLPVSDLPKMPLPPDIVSVLPEPV